MGDQEQDTILQRFRDAVGKLYGDRLDRVILFGSRARGDARPDSDYDIAVFLRGFEDRWRERDRIVWIEEEILEATGAVIYAIPFAVGALDQRTPLMHEIRREGIVL